MKYILGFYVALAAVLLTTYTVTGAKMLGRQAAPSSFWDTKGHKVTLAAKPMRIASVVLGVDENLMDLVDPSRIVTMTEISKDPFVSNVASRVPARAALIKSDWQKVVDTKPDLVLAATYTPTLADPLIARNLPVYQFSEFRSVDELLKNFEILGRLVGEERKAQEIIAADRSVLANAARKTPSSPMRAIYFSEGNIFARGNVPSDVLTLAGLRNAAADSGKAGIVKATPEVIEAFHPDVIFFGEDSKTAEDQTRAMFRKPEYQKISAVKAGRVYPIPGKHITTTSHNIVRAVEDVQMLLSPSR